MCHNHRHRLITAKNRTRLFILSTVNCQIWGGEASCCRHCGADASIKPWRHLHSFLNEIVRVLSISFPEILVLKACVVAESWQSVSTNFERNLFLDDNNSKIEFMYTQTY